MKPAALLGLAVLFAGHSESSIAAAAARNVEVIATDYAFQIPETLSPGATTFHLTNQGKHPHELNIFLLRRGATLKQVLDSQRAGKTTQGLVESSVGVLFADNAKTSPLGLTTNLLPGREYGVICIFSDSAKAPRHFDLGMYKLIHVSAGSAASTFPRADSIIAYDYSFRYPATLKPGKHSFVFTNAGKHRHEVNIALLKPGVTLAKIVELDKTDGDIVPLLDDAGAVLWARAGEKALGRLDVDLLPGREYLLECGFQDDDKSPPHYKLGMSGSIRVAKVSGK